MDIYADPNVKKATIDTPFPYEQFRDILFVITGLEINIFEKAEYKQFEQFTDEQFENLLREVFHRFLKGTLSIDDIADISEMLFMSYRKDESRRKDLIDIFVAMSELEWHVRQRELRTFVHFHQKLFDHFQKKLIEPK